MFKHSTRPRHAVVDESGRALDDTARFPQLHAVGELVRNHRDEEAPTLLLPVLDARAAVSRILPVHGDQTIVLRRPQPPAVPSLANRFPRSFFEIPEFVEQIRLIQVRAHGSSLELMDRVNQRMGALLRRARSLSAAWRYRAADGAGHDLAVAYREHGTGTMPAITDELAKQIVERAKAGSGVAA
jgi:hypothetical protein